MYEDSEISEIFEEIQIFLDCPTWRDFCLSLSNHQNPQKASNNLIPSIIENVSNGILQPSSIFAKNDISRLVDSFISSPDRRFFNIASYLLNDSKKCASLPFFELLLKRSPQTMISLINPKDSKIFDQYVRIMTKSYVSKEDRFISDALCKYKLSLVLRELFLTISNVNKNGTKYSYNYDTLKDDTENEFDTKSTVSLLYELWKINNKKNNLSNFYSSLQNESSVAFEFHLDNVINSILDFIQFGSEHQLFEYSIVFGNIFGKSSNQYFVAVLLERMNKTNESFVQIQIELIDREAAKPLREEMRKSDRFQKKNMASSSLNNSVNLTEKDLLSLSMQYVQKGSIPERIAQLHMFNKQFLVNKVAPDLRKLAKENQQAKLLVEALEKKKLIPLFKETPRYETVIETLRDTDSTMAQFPDVLSKVKSEEYAPKFFNAFHKALYLRHADNIKLFCDRISETIIYHLEDIKSFTLEVVKFLTGSICEQHRKSLSLLAVRCPLHDFIESSFFNHKREVQIINDLHEAAIQSCSYLSSKKINSNLKAVYFDPLLNLRLRWRNIRGDHLGTISWLPEFISLVDNDVVKFLKWELNENKPQNLERRSVILAKLGITTNFSKIPIILHHLLMAETPEKTVVDALIPILNNCPAEKVSLPEKVNISILFRINSILWSKSVMNHPEILKILRENPSVEISQSLLMSCDLNSLNFICFPIGFYALIVNCNELVGQKPEILDSISALINRIESGNQFDVPFDLPKYAKISLIAFLARKKFDLSLFFTCDDEFASICIFFMICFKRFNDAVNLLNQNDRIIQFLMSNFIDGLAFVGQNQWMNSLIEFAIFCAENDVFYEPKSWSRFISLIFKEEWPQYIVENQSNFCVLNNYMKNHEIHVV